jgi:hypothetical protein
VVHSGFHSRGRIGVESSAQAVPRTSTPSRRDL